MRRMRVLASILAVLPAGCGGDEKSDPCADVNCSAHGECIARGSSAECRCDDGYEPLGLTCVDGGGDSDTDTDTDSDPCDVPDEVGNDEDENCDGVDGVDGDGDSWPSEASGGSDCDDDDDAVYPGADDDVGDDVDQSCDDIDGMDADYDGFASEDSGGDDCDDEDDTVNPGAPDPVGVDGDTNCDLTDGVDADGDGYASIASGGDDCDDSNPDANPGLADDEAWSLYNFVILDDNVGDYASIAVDAAGDPRIAFWNGVLAEVMLAVWDGDSWGVSSVPLALAPPFAFAIGADDVAHVVSTGTGTMQHASDPGGVWEQETVLDVNGQWVDLAVDGGGVIGVAYQGVIARDLRFVTDASDEWVDTRIELEGGADVRLALDVDGVFHIAHYAAAPLFEVRSAVGAPEVWTVGTVDDSVPVAFRGVAIVADAGGSDHVFHGDGGLTYATNEAGDWTTEVVDAAPNAGGFPDVAMDAGGGLHVVHQDLDDPDGSLQYATNVSGEWVLEEVDGTGGAYATIAIGGGAVHVAHKTQGEFELWYATRPLPDGIDVDCDGVD